MNATLFLDAALDALLDSLRMLPFLFVAFLILEALEHYSSNRLTHFFQHKKGGPAIGSGRCGRKASARQTDHRHSCRISG